MSYVQTTQHHFHFESEQFAISVVRQLNKVSFKIIFLKCEFSL